MMKQGETVQHEAAAVQTAHLHPTKNLEALEDPAILVLKRTSESGIPDTDCHVTSSLTDENSNVVITTKKTLRRPLSRHVHKGDFLYIFSFRCCHHEDRGRTSGNVVNS
jgi:hypothetical protein